MATTPTNKPIPSEDPRDLKFNAGKIDEEVNGSADYYTDRFSVQRLTNTGRINQFNAAQLDRANRFEQFLLSSGYAFLGDYENGPFQFSARNQYIRYDNQYYRLNASTDVGFTTTGIDADSFANDVTHFVLMDGDTLRQQLASADVGVVSVNYIHVFNVPTRPFAYYLAKNSGNVMLAIREAAASGETIIFESGKTYDIDENDIPFAQRTGFIGPEGSYVNFNITNPAGTYGTFDLRASNDLNGGRYNRFRNLRFRYPNQIKTIDETNTAPIVYPPLFHGGAFESRFECLDVGNAYYAFRIGGVVNSVDSGTASRVVFDQIIGAPIYIGLALTQVRDVPVIQNIRWNYNYLDGSTSEYAYDTTLKQWMHDNSVAFRFGRIDWATIINLFAYGYLYTFFEQAWGYTGSADRLKFIGCTADHSVYPVYLQNFSNRATFVACGFTGDYGSEFTRIAPNIIYINDVGDSNAIVSFTDCTFNNFSGSVIRTNGTRVELNGGRIWGFGYDSTSSLVRNAVELTASSILKISDTKIDASAGSYTRCVFDGGYGNSELYLSGTAELVGATYESYRWNGGTDGGNKEYIERGVKIEGFTTSVNCRGVISFYTQKHIYPGISMPTSGAYQSGDEVKNMTLTIQGVAGSRYVIKGWLRVTTGSSHVLNTDWVAIKQLTGD